MAMKESAPSPGLLCSLAGMQDKGGSAALPWEETLGWAGSSPLLPGEWGQEALFPDPLTVLTGDQPRKQRTF